MLVTKLINLSRSLHPFLPECSASQPKKTLRRTLTPGRDDDGASPEPDGLPAEPVDLKDSSEHLGVNASRKHPVDGRAAVLGLRGQPSESWEEKTMNGGGGERGGVLDFFVLTLKLSALSDREDEDDAPCRAERRIQLLLIDR